MFERIEEAVAVGRLDREPLPSRAEIDVPVVRRKRGERFEAGPDRIGGCKVYGVVPLPHIEGAAVRLHAFDDGGNHDVRVRIAIAVCVGAQIVGHQETAYLDELGDRLSVVPGDTRSKVLRGFDAARCGLNGQPWNRDRCARAARIRVENLITNENSLCEIWILDVQILDVRRHCDGIGVRCYTDELQFQGQRLAVANVERFLYFGKAHRRRAELIVSLCHR
jgi:hypothetical protein